MSLRDWKNEIINMCLSFINDCPYTELKIVNEKLHICGKNAEINFGFDDDEINEFSNEIIKFSNDIFDQILGRIGYEVYMYDTDRNYTGFVRVFDIVPKDRFDRYVIEFHYWIDKTLQEHKFEIKSDHWFCPSAGGLSNVYLDISNEKEWFDNQEIIPKTKEDDPE